MNIKINIQDSIFMILDFFIMVMYNRAVFNDGRKPLINRQGRSLSSVFIAVKNCYRQRNGIKPVRTFFVFPSDTDSRGNTAL